MDAAAWLFLVSVAGVFAVGLAGVTRLRGRGWDPAQSRLARLPLLDRWLVGSAVCAALLGLIAAEIPYPDCGDLVFRESDGGSICGDYHLMSGALVLMCALGLLTLAALVLFRSARRKR